MIRRTLLAWAGLTCAELALAGATPAAAQMPSTFNPNMVSGTMNPVVNNQCSGNRCTRKRAPAQRQGTASAANSRATCAHARTITPKPSEKARLARLLALCEQGGY
ncbi:hypothetical protein [Novosphingobium sp.]|uniref:hypothetical protein n=1 Tax=Novosphingobium sp. TaxID=1874826 RepID=UPI002FE096FA